MRETALLLLAFIIMFTSIFYLVSLAAKQPKPTYEVCQGNKCELWKNISESGGWGTKCVYEYNGASSTRFCGEFTIKEIE